METLPTIPEDQAGRETFWAHTGLHSAADGTDNAATEYSERPLFELRPDLHEHRW
jgi:hypothetical protein